MYGNNSKRNGKEAEFTDNTTILDTGATFSSFKQASLLVDKKTAENPIRMQTNVGSRTIEKVVNVPGFKAKIWCDEKSLANIFSFANMVDQYCVTYNNEKEDAFIVHSKNGKLKFLRSQEGLYFHKFNNSYKKLVEKNNTGINCLNTMRTTWKGTALDK